MTANPTSFEATYKTIDECVITTDVYLPTNTTSSECPTIINFHGGGFVVGHSKMNSMLQIQDCLERGWIVVAPDYRLCPQVDIYDGPIKDSQDLMAWIQQGGLDQEIQKQGSTLKVAQNKIIAMGTSAGGTLSYSLAFPSVSSSIKPPLAILDFYGPKQFTDPFWKEPLSFIPAPPLTPEMEAELMAVHPIPIKGGISLEGQSGPAGPSKPDPRHAYCLQTIKQGKVLENLYPKGFKDVKELVNIDPILNITKDHPPTCIVHGDADVMVLTRLSHAMFNKLKEAGIECEFISVEGESHSFVGKMQGSGKTWDTQRKGFDWVEKQIARVAN